ncbi:MAG: ACT domain-containing protein [Planctomycetota bacterium]|jgi:hypothetical protein
MEVAEQLSVFLENKPGVLASVCSALGEAGVNLRAISVSDTVDHAVVRLVTTDSGLARSVLERGGALVVETNVLVLTLANKPGALAEVAGKLSGAEVNIEYSYGSASGEAAGILVIRVDDVEKARKALA